MVVETKHVVVKPKENWLTPCNHPIPMINENGTLTNKDIYSWVSQYQKALEDCNTKIESIKEFYD